MVLRLPYEDLPAVNASSCVISDHMGGFDPELRCAVIDRLILNCSEIQQVSTEYLADQKLRDRYPEVSINFDVDLWKKGNFIDHFYQHTLHPINSFEHFLCSFNGSAHVSRKLLVAILHKFGYFNYETCSKNFRFSNHTIDGHVHDLAAAHHRIYRKFFAAPDSDEFFQKIIGFGHRRFEHHLNVQKLAVPITQSFFHLVSETLATSYYPFVTEKFLYSVVNRGLFLAYAQPGWHDHLYRYFGFKPYNKIFDYNFDNVMNPVTRLIELISMISKFSVLSPADWHDLYEMELDTIEYNYDHFFSKRYLQCLGEHDRSH